MRVYAVDCDAPPDRVWTLISRPERWSEWSPYVSGAESLGSPEVAEGAEGSVVLRGGLRLAARVTRVVRGESWTWRRRTDGSSRRSPGPWWAIADRARGGGLDPSLVDCGDRLRTDRGPDRPQHRPRGRARLIGLPLPSPSLGCDSCLPQLSSPSSSAGCRQTGPVSPLAPRQWRGRTCAARGATRWGYGGSGRSRGRSRSASPSASRRPAAADRWAVRPSERGESGAKTVSINAYRLVNLERRSDRAARGQDRGGGAGATRRRGVAVASNARLRR